MKLNFDVVETFLAEVKTRVYCSCNSSRAFYLVSREVMRDLSAPVYLVVWNELRRELTAQVWENVYRHS